MGVSPWSFTKYFKLKVTKKYFYVDRYSILCYIVYTVLGGGVE
jgi:hypothetical protein